MLGSAVTTSSIGVGGRCPHVRAGVGAVNTQNVTDPRLGPAILDALATGLGAERALERVLAGARHAEYRQLAVIDAAGATAHHSGLRTYPEHAAAPGEDCLALGNLLAAKGVPDAMRRAFEGGASRHLAERLVLALEAGARAGGEHGPVRSAVLLVARDLPWPLVDLRVDWDDDPIGHLRALWERYEPEMEAYVIRALDPPKAPRFNVPGDM
jgi:uncharacterized Ntn-hydrolase superfamily protein